MELLSTCPVLGPAKKSKVVREYWIVDKKDAADTRRDPLTLIVTSDHHDFVIYTLDRAETEWEGKRPEAVLVADLVTCQLVCFLELKATMKGDPEVYRRAKEQVTGGIRHFCPEGRQGGPRTHGDEHHDRFAAGADALLVVPAKDHLVRGVSIALRQAPPRPLPTRELIGGKDIDFLLISVPAEGFNRARLTLEELCRKVGVPAR
jgi:hypothetical protein